MTFSVGLPHQEGTGSPSAWPIKRWITQLRCHVDSDLVREHRGVRSPLMLLRRRWRARRRRHSEPTVTGCAGVGAVTFTGGGPSALLPAHTELTAAPSPTVSAEHEITA